MFNSAWYYSLNQPVLTPPAWVFAPVWTILYISMLIALFLYTRKCVWQNKNWGYVLFFAQLFMNLIWSPIFFGLKNIGLALAVIITLDTLVLFTITEFFRISKSAGRTLIPYFVWILFATYLNWGIYILN